jgi:hypothetical protein
VCSSDLVGVVNITASGDITAVNAILSGDLSAVGGTFTGDVSAVNGTLTGDLGVVNITASGDITGVNGILSGNLTAVDGTFSGDVSVGDWMNYGVQSTVTITDAETLTPTGTYQIVQCSAGGGCTLPAVAIANGATIGDVLIIQITGSNDVVITDDQNVQLGAATRTLTAAKGDLIQFIWNGTDWFEISFSDIN